jgi:esterase/lipase
MNKINRGEARILLDCKYLVAHLKDIKEATNKMHEEPDESLLECYLQIFDNLESLKDSYIESAVKVSEKASWWNQKIVHNLIQDITHHFSHVEQNLIILQENLNKPQLSSEML